MKRKVLVSMGMCLMLFFSFATMTQAGYVNFDVTVAANGNHPDPLSPRMQKEDSENRYYVTPTSIVVQLSRHKFNLFIMNRYM